MKKFILSVFSMLAVAAGMQAQELIADNEFDKADLSIPFGNSDTATFGVWCSVNNEEGASFRIVDDKTRGKALEFSCDPKLSTWYKAFVAQRCQGTVEPGMYRLSFWAKSEDMGQVKAFIRLTDANGKDQQRFFVCTQSQPKKADRKFYGGFGKANPSGKWSFYTLDFDFSKASNTIYLFAMTETEETTETDRTDFSLCFQNSAAEPSSILIDSVSLKKIEEQPATK